MTASTVGNYRVVDEFTIWRFMIALHEVDAGFLQTWRMTNGAAGLEIFIGPEYRRRGNAVRALHRMAQHLLETLRWEKLPSSPTPTTNPQSRVLRKQALKTGTSAGGDGDHAHIILEWP